jgi:hypothetical protein
MEPVVVYGLFVILWHDLVELCARGIHARIGQAARYIVAPADWSR